MMMMMMMMIVSAGFWFDFEKSVHDPAFEGRISPRALPQTSAIVIRKVCLRSIFNL